MEGMPTPFAPLPALDYPPGEQFVLENFLLYGERVGGLSVLCEDAEAAGRVLGQLKQPFAATTQPAEFWCAGGGCGAEGLVEVEMRTRILAMRQELVKVLSTEMPERNFDYLLNQRGMFSYTGLSTAQADRLREEFGVYLIASGRNVSPGLTRKCASRGKGVCCGDVILINRRISPPVPDSSHPLLFCPFFAHFYIIYFL
ncbi:hypothetical protein DMI62_03445 [Escherichia coli]|nr:hypothetical protein [Escherichia coli]